MRGHILFAFFLLEDCAAFPQNCATGSLHLKEQTQFNVSCSSGNPACITHATLYSSVSLNYVFRSLEWKVHGNQNQWGTLYGGLIMSSWYKNG